jgi:hypothetical protein
MSANEIVDTFCKLQRGVVVAEIVFAKGHMDLTKTVLAEVKGYCENLLTRLGEVNDKEDGASKQHAEDNSKRDEATKGQPGNKAKSKRRLDGELTVAKIRELKAMAKENLLPIKDGMIEIPVTPRPPLRRKK